MTLLHFPRLSVGLLLCAACFVSGLPTLFADDTVALPATDDGLPGAGPIRRYDWFQSLWNHGVPHGRNWLNRIRRPSCFWVTRSHRAGAMTCMARFLV